MAALGLITVLPGHSRSKKACAPSNSSSLAQKHRSGCYVATRPSKAAKMLKKHLVSSQNTACRSAAVDTAEAEADLMELELKVEGMVCDGCSSRVAEALKAMNGVDKVDVNLSTGIATIEVHAADPIEAFNRMPPMVEKIGQLGFKAQAHFEDWA